MFLACSTSQNAVKFAGEMLVIEIENKKCFGNHNLNTQIHFVRSTPKSLRGVIGLQTALYWKAFGQMNWNLVWSDSMFESHQPGDTRYKNCFQHRSSINKINYPWNKLYMYWNLVSALGWHANNTESEECTKSLSTSSERPWLIELQSRNLKTSLVKTHSNLIRWR